MSTPSDHPAPGSATDEPVPAETPGGPERDLPPLQEERRPPLFGSMFDAPSAPPQFKMDGETSTAIESLVRTCAEKRVQLRLSGYGDLVLSPYDAPKDTAAKIQRLLPVLETLFFALRSLPPG